MSCWKADHLIFRLTFPYLRDAVCRVSGRTYRFDIAAEGLVCFQFRNRTSGCIRTDTILSKVLRASSLSGALRAIESMEPSRVLLTTSAWRIWLRPSKTEEGNSRLSKLR